MHRRHSDGHNKDADCGGTADVIKRRIVMRSVNVMPVQLTGC